MRLGLQATVFDVTLHAGDALYLPACWYHAVSGGSGPNISFIHW
jgi:ribosomal protein L16 Arg81 hydroxylase